MYSRPRMNLIMDFKQEGGYLEPKGQGKGKVKPLSDMWKECIFLFLWAGDMYLFWNNSIYTQKPCLMRVLKNIIYHNYGMGILRCNKYIIKAVEHLES